MPEPLEFVVPPDRAGARLDAFLAERLAKYSRVFLRRAITAGGVTVDGQGTKVAYRLRPGQRVRLEVPDLPRTGPVPEDIPLSVLYEDDDLAVIDKPPHMVVHPARGHWSGTLASALQHRFGQLSGLGGPSRPGIIHRLDRDTSGVILVARHDRAHRDLAMQFEGRTIEKEYFALTAGVPDRDRDVIDRPIGLHPAHREKMAIRPDDDRARSAQTVYEVVERFAGFAAVRLLPQTGRTHQLRVHLASIGCPVLCDRQYGGRARLLRGELSRDAADETVLLERQALHARRLRFRRPCSGEPLEAVAPLPADIVATLEALRRFRRL